MAITTQVPEQLNLEGKKVFDAVIKTLVNGTAKIGGDSYGLMPLSVECVSDEMQTPWGAGKIYSFCHYYEQNGDQMQDPEVTFLVVDNRHVVELAAQYKIQVVSGTKDAVAYDFFGVWPMTFLQANMAIYQEALVINETGSVKFSKPMQHDITVFCNEWMQSIFHQVLKGSLAV